MSPYLPFGAGRHPCIGEQFAYLQISTIITALVRRMEFRFDGEFPKSDYAVRLGFSFGLSCWAWANGTFSQSMMVQPMPCQILYRRRHFD